MRSTLLWLVLQPRASAVPESAAAATDWLSVRVCSSATKANSLFLISGPLPYRPTTLLVLPLSRFQYSRLPSVLGLAPVFG